MTKPIQRTITYQVGNQARDITVWAKADTTDATTEIDTHVWLTCFLDQDQTKEVSIRCSSIIALSDAE